MQRGQTKKKSPLPLSTEDGAGRTLQPQNLRAAAESPGTVRAGERAALALQRAGRNAATSLTVLGSRAWPRGRQAARGHQAGGRGGRAEPRGRRARETGSEATTALGAASEQEEDAKVRARGREARAEARAPPAAEGGRRPASTRRRTGQRGVEVQGLQGRDGGKLWPAGAGTPRLRMEARAAVGPAGGRSAARCSNFTGPRGRRGPGPRRPSPGSRQARGGAGKGSPQRDRPGLSPLTGPRSRRRRRGSARSSSSMVPPRRGRPTPPPRTSPHAAARGHRLRPGHSRGHAPSRRGARPEQEGGSAPAPPTRAHSRGCFTRIGERLGQWGASRPARSVCAGGRGIAEEEVSPLVLRPRSRGALARVPFQVARWGYFGPSLSW